MKLLKIYFLLRLCSIGLVIAIYALLIGLLLERFNADPLAGLAKIQKAEASRVKPSQEHQTVAKLNP